MMSREMIMNLCDDRGIEARFGGVEAKVVSLIMKLVLLESRLPLFFILQRMFSHGRVVS